MRVVPDLLARRTALVPDRTALISPRGEELTYADWQDRARRAAGSLAGNGLAPAQRVALLIRDRDILDFAISYIAVQMAGGVPVIASARWSSHELRGLLAEVGVVGVIASADVPDLGLSDVWQSDLATLVVDDVDQGLSPVTSSPDALAQILFTSATTGRAKPVAATHRNLVDAFQDRVVDDLRELEQGEVFVHALPLGTNAAQSMLLTCLTEPDITLVLDGFDPRTFCAAVRTHRATGTLMVPAMAHALLAHTDAHTDAHSDSQSDGHSAELSALRVLGLTGAATPPSTLARLAALCPQAVIKNFYTSTESWPVGVNTAYDPARPGSVGRAPGEDTLVVHLPDGRPAAPGQTGEVLLRGGSSAGRGYLGRDEDFAPDDGWVHTGDLGYIDEDGYLYLVDRSSRIISSGGFKIAPQEVEETLLGHPALGEATVFGVPHHVLGSLLVAAVVPSPAWNGAAFPTERELRDHVAARLSPVKIPHRFLTLDRLPLTAGDKVDVRRLREQYEALRPLYAPPVGHVEQMVCDVWQNLLAVDRIGRLDDFFESGGDSITATRGLALLNADFDVELPLSAFYETRTPAGLAALITTARDAGSPAKPRSAPAPEPTLPDGVYPCSPLQRKIWELAEAADDGGRRGPSSNNVHQSVLLDGPLDPAQLARAVERLCDRHAILRTVFVAHDDEPMQHVTGQPRLELRTRALPQAQDARHPALAAAITEANDEAFELTAGPTASLTLFALGNGHTMLHWVFGASVADGWTTGLLTRELAELYRAPGHAWGQAPSFGDNTVEWARLLGSPEGESRHTYWERSLAAPVTLPVFPGGVSDVSPVMDRSCELVLQPRRVDEVKALARYLGATPYAVWVSAYALTLTAWNPDMPVSLFVPVLGRTRPGSDQVAGPCAAQSVLRFTPGSEGTVATLVTAVRDTLAELQHHLLPTLRTVAGVDIDDVAQLQFVSLAEDAQEPDFGTPRVLPAPGGSRPGGDLPEDGWPGVALAAHLGQLTDDQGQESHLFDLSYDSRILPDGNAFLRALDAVLSFTANSPLGKPAEARAAAAAAWQGSAAETG